jgi:hypothetical protein
MTTLEAVAIFIVATGFSGENNTRPLICETKQVGLILNQVDPNCRNFHQLEKGFEPENPEKDKR